MEIFKVIAMLCQLNGAGADSASLIEFAEKKQLSCQQYYVKCIDPVDSKYKTISKCVQQRKL
jgi:hypothetical protein